MKPLSIGILGGAGPMAGALLLERVFHFASSLYGCHKDGDFPEVILLSFPFSEMLSSEIDEFQLKKELHEALEKLRKNGTEVLAIACNTLHAFLEEIPPDLIHLPRAVADEIGSFEKPLVLCTSTSVRRGVHQQFFTCQYPSLHVQIQIDAIIDRTLKGEKPQKLSRELMKLIASQPQKVIVLGCTELSVLFQFLDKTRKEIIDPLDILAKKILKKSFHYGMYMSSNK